MTYSEVTVSQMIARSATCYRNCRIALTISVELNARSKENSKLMSIDNAVDG
jgi:hypothetical protein